MYNLIHTTFIVIGTLNNDNMQCAQLNLLLMKIMVAKGSELLAMHDSILKYL